VFYGKQDHYFFYILCQQRVGDIVSAVLLVRR